MIKQYYIDILSTLIDKKTQLSLEEISNNLSYKIGTRSFQRYMQELIKAKRIYRYGQGPSTVYALSIVERIIFDPVYVYVDDYLAGVLGYLEDESFGFSYTNEFLISQRPPISTLEKSIYLFKSNELFPVFEELLPEGIDRKMLEYKTGETREHILLLELSEQVGNISFSRDKNITKKVYKKGISYFDAKEEILGKNVFPNILNYAVDIDKDLLFVGDISKSAKKGNFSLSGFQHKFHIEVDEEKKIVRELKRGESARFFIKPYNKNYIDARGDRYFPYHLLNEHLYISFAKNELKFDAPWSALLWDGKDFHYIVKRFDKYENTCFSKTNFSSFLGLCSRDKYKISTEKMLERVKKELLDKKERMTLLKYLFYSIMIIHEDMHTKNLSIMRQGKKSIMSPIYDIATTKIYADLSDKESTLTINGKQQNIRINDFKGLCKILDLDFKEFKSEAFLMTKIYEEKMPLYIEKIRELGKLPFAKRKVKTSYAQESRIVKEKKEFWEILDENFRNRIESLRELGWIQN